MQFLDFFVTSNNEVYVCSNKKLVMFIRDLNPSNIVFSRRVMTNQLLQKRYNKCLLELEDQLKYVSNVALIINRSEDVFNNSIYAMIDIINTKQWIFDIIHFIYRSK